MVHLFRNLEGARRFEESFLISVSLGECTFFLKLRPTFKQMSPTFKVLFLKGTPPSVIKGNIFDHFLNWQGSLSNKIFPKVLGDLWWQQKSIKLIIIAMKNLLKVRFLKFVSKIINYMRILFCKTIFDTWIYVVPFHFIDKMRGQIKIDNVW